MTQLLAINGSYREDGAIDQAVDVAVQAAIQSGATIEVIHLRDFAIGFCLNSRHCTQVAGDAPGVRTPHNSEKRRADKELYDRLQCRPRYFWAPFLFNIETIKNDCKDY